jgi:CRP/FNR family transcriptional regulator
MNSLPGANGCGDAAWPYRAAEELARALSAEGERRRLESGERLFSFGDAAEGVYLIAKGTARATLGNAPAGELGCRVVGAGSVLGLPSALCSTRYQFDVEAVEAVEAVFLPTATVNEILRRQPELCMQVMGMMCDELTALKQTHDHMKNCTRESCSLLEQCRQGSGLQ